MSLLVLPAKAAVTFGVTKSFTATGGVAPYVYSIVADGAGGTIDQNGFYGAPATSNDNPSKTYDTIKAVDANGTIAYATALVCNHLQLVCDILQTELGLADGRVYLWDQKIKEPTDYGMYIVVNSMSCKPFSNTRKNISPEITGDGMDGVQSTNFHSTLSIDIFSRGPSARDRKEEVVMALMSYYATSQQEANSFRIAKLPSNIVNLSQVDGSAILYRFNLTVTIQYFIKATKAIPYFDNFSTEEISIEP